MRTLIYALAAAGALAMMALFVTGAGPHLATTGPAGVHAASTPGPVPPPSGPAPIVVTINLCTNTACGPAYPVPPVGSTGPAYDPQYPVAGPQINAPPAQK